MIEAIWARIGHAYRNVSFRNVDCKITVRAERIRSIRESLYSVPPDGSKMPAATARNASPPAAAPRPSARNRRGCRRRQRASLEVREEQLGRSTMVWRATVDEDGQYSFAVPL